MSWIGRTDWFKRLCLVLACLVVMPSIAGVAQAARAAERNELRALGLLDAVLCHSDGAAAADHPSPEPGRKMQHAQCECCLTGCGAAGPVGLPDDRGAVLRPLRLANVRAEVALDAAALRSYLSERTRSPRSPPMPG